MNSRLVLRVGEAALRLAENSALFPPQSLSSGFQDSRKKPGMASGLL